MLKRNIRTMTAAALGSLLLGSCKLPALVEVKENRNVPTQFAGAGTDTASAAAKPWRLFFTDSNLVHLIDTALARNQELRITLQELTIARNDIRLRQGQLLPFVRGRVGIGAEKVGRYTSQGAGDAATEIEEGKEVPETITDYTGAVYATWEADIWKKLRNAKKAAISRYLATVEGRSFVQTELVGEVANSYYELLALDNQLAIIRQNIALQQNGLEIVKVQKQAARVTELAVQKFAAEVLRTQSLEWEVRQRITETENRINFLLGRFPQPVPRSGAPLLEQAPPAVAAGIPAQLLVNRPDIRRAEQELAAAKLDVLVARAEFLPSLGITAGVGLQAFRPAYLVKLPESVLFSLAGDLAGPLINKSAIRAEYSSAGARQLQALYRYERTVLNAYFEVSNQVASIGNLEQSLGFRTKEVAALTQSIDISNSLFASARADYLEVLMTQRDVLESKLELVETKRNQLAAAVNLYRGLGGGWR
ncbi:MAG: efflux transporter outer membrane subunit [Chitinophagaceae bacterium]|nr:MAG: efflux transporter outer membrane subunit [Chitinophagaceae bacterium]